MGLFSRTNDTGQPVNLDKVAHAAPGLVDLHKTAGVSLAKKNLTGIQAAVYLVLDHSGSMRPFYADGSVQGFSERVLALATNLDDDGVVPVVLFDSIAHPAHDLVLGRHEGAIETIRAAAGRMGTTNYAAAINAVTNLHQSSYPGRDVPALVVFQTDGNPDHRGAAQQALCNAAQHPLFFSFVGFGSDSFDFLRKLDELPVPKTRPIDNAGFFTAGSAPAQYPANRLYDNLIAEFGDWLTAARGQGILR